MKRNYYVILLFLSLMNGSLSAQLIDKDATKETIALYQQLFTLIRNKQILLGQQDATAYGITWKNAKDRSDMKTVSGTHPALYGWDVGGIEKGSGKNIDGVDFGKMRRLITEAYQRGGTNTISWHVTNPVSNQSPWGTQTMSTIDSILPGANYHEKYNKYLDRLASFLESLKTEDGVLIPIIFRPFHEHTGDWFWWGASQNSINSYVQLWKYTVSYLRDVKNLHHLIYAYSPDITPSPETYFERYPGDDFADVLGFDYYHFGGAETAPQFVAEARNMLLYICEQAKTHNKPAAFTETGLETINQHDWWTNVLYKTIDDIPIAYVLVWRNANNRPNHFYGPVPNHPANNDFLRLIQKKNIITGNKLVK